LIYKLDTAFPDPDYRSETVVEIAFVKEDDEVYRFPHLAESIDYLESDLDPVSECYMYGYSFSYTSLYLQHIYE